MGIYLTDLTGEPIYDALGSMIIGLLLMGFALICAYENQSLLIGEGVTRKKRKELLQKLPQVGGVNSVVDLRTMHLGPDKVLVGAEIKFEDNLSTNQIEEKIDLVERKIKLILPQAENIFIEVESID